MSKMDAAWDTARLACSDKVGDASGHVEQRCRIMCINKLAVLYMATVNAVKVSLKMNREGEY